MRQVDKDEFPGLGEVIKPPEMPQPHKKIMEGVYKDPSGKLYTTIPTPPSPNIWDRLKSTGTKP